LPLLTLLAINPRKPIKLLKLDLTIIAAPQTLAFGYRIRAVAAARPSLVVADLDTFILVAVDEHQ
jgi:hypothetical protein